MRAALEQQMAQLRVDDLLVQTAASLVNLTARRIGKPDEQDLEQGRQGIDALSALAEVLPAEFAAQVKNALTELQMLYAREAGGGAGEAPGGDEGGDPPATGEGGAPGPGQGGQPAGGPPPPAPGGGAADPPPRLWTPRGST